MVNHDPSGNDVNGKQRPRTVRSFTLMSDILAQPTEFLGLGIALGELNLLDGDPGTNKSCLTLDIAARISTGRAMPDGTKGRAGGALLLLAEDSLRKTVRPRLEAAGAHLGRVAIMNEVVRIPDELDSVEQAARQVKAKLIVIDPIMAFLARNANFDQSVRQALGKLKQIAERTNAAVLLVRHLNKSGGTQSLYRGSGSIGIIAAARSALLAANDPEDTNMRVLCHVKCNLGPLAPSLLYEPVTAENGSVKIEWRGECDYKPENLLVVSPDRDGRLDQAKRFLLEALVSGPVLQQKLKHQAVVEQLAWRTVARAKEELGIVSVRKGWGPGSKWIWKLPA